MIYMTHGAHTSLTDVTTQTGYIVTTTAVVIKMFKKAVSLTSVLVFYVLFLHLSIGGSRRVRNASRPACPVCCYIRFYVCWCIHLYHLTNIRTVDAHPKCHGSNNYVQARLPCKHTDYLLLHYGVGATKIHVH